MNSIKANKAFGRIIYHRIFINLGDSLFYIVLMWILYDLTKNSFYTAIGGFMFSLSDVLNFVVGPLIDRCEKGKLLVATSGIAFFVIAGLFVLSIGDIMNVWILIVSIPAFNLMSRITYSIHNVIVPDIVQKDELTVANSILSVTNTGIDLLFNAVSGILLVIVNLQEIFLINSIVNFLALLAAILAFRNGVSARKKTVCETGNFINMYSGRFLETYLKDLKNGLVFIRNRTILSLIIPLTGLNVMYAMMLVNLPEFSSEIFGSAIGYGLVLTFFAIGSISGSIISNFLIKRFAIGKLIPAVFLYGGASWILVSVFIKQIPFLGVIFIIAAMNALGITNIIFGTIFQQLPPKNMIGRVNTVNLSLMAAAALLGSLLGGMITKISDYMFSFALCGFGYLFIALFMIINNSVRKLPQMSKVNEDIL